MTAHDRTRPSKADTSKLDGGASPRLRWIEFGRSSPAAIGIHVPLGVGLLGIYVLVASASRNQASVQGR